MVSKSQLNTLYRYAIALSNNNDLAYDLVHDAVLQIRGKLLIRKMAYLKTCIRNNFYDLYKKQKKDEQQNHYDDVINKEVDLDDYLCSKQQLSNILADLNPNERELLYLLYVERYSYKEAAKFFNVKIGTVMSRLHRCKFKITDKGRS